MSDGGEGINLDLGGFIRQAIGEGMGVTAARDAMREAGVARLSNEAFGELYGQIRASVGEQSDLAGLDYEAAVPAEAMGEWAAGEADRFYSFVEVHVREPGSRAVSTRFYTYVTDEAHSPQEAVDAAMDVMDDAAADQGTDFDAVPLAGVVTSTGRMTGRG